MNLLGNNNRIKKWAAYTFWLIFIVIWFISDEKRARISLSKFNRSKRYPGGTAYQELVRAGGENESEEEELVRAGGEDESEEEGSQHEDDCAIWERIADT